MNIALRLLDRKPRPPWARAGERFDFSPPRLRLPLLALAFICLLFHAAFFGLIALADLFRQDFAALDEEVAVEVITEPPAQAKQIPEPPPPPEQPPPEPKPPPSEPQKQALTLDEKPAFDAPRAENKELVKREAPDERTQAQQRAAPNEQTAPLPDPQHPQKPQQAAEPRPVGEESAASRPEDGDRPGEIIEQATLTPSLQPDHNPQKSGAKTTSGERQASVADIVASFEPLPDFKLGGAAKTAPISGGTATPSYLSVVYGYIKRKFHNPGGGRPGEGVIIFYVDPNGHLIHQALRHSSGSATLDQAAMSALRQAGPFPPTPTATALGIEWRYY